MKIKRLIVMLSLALSIHLSGCGRSQPTLVTSTDISDDNNTDSSQDINAEAASVSDNHSEYVYVYISGAVVAPGVYELTSGSRLYEAIELAGGFCPDAKEDYLNLAACVEDGVQYVVPTKSEAALLQQENIGQSAMVSHYDTEGRLNINVATKDELMELPGIGATRADAILAYRDTGNIFDNPEDIMKVSGIKDSVYGSVKDYIVTK